MIDKIKRIVLISEAFQRNLEKATYLNRNLEMSSYEYTQDLRKALENIIDNVIIYNSPSSFQQNITKHINDLVMTIYGGETSRNRMALIPAICEAHNIKYLGADTYARIICQDKQITKELVKRIGFKTANYLLIEKEKDIELINYLTFPVVVKPNLEGSSIGISSNNLIDNINEAKELTKKLLNDFNQPILVEEFISGKEVSICISGTCKVINHLEVIEDYHKEEEHFFNNNLYTFDLKLLHYDNFKHRLITKNINNKILELSRDLFFKLKKVDYLRIDGKLVGNDFYIIEATPDPYIAFQSGFANSFKLNNIKYENAIKLLISNTLKSFELKYNGII